MLHLITDKYKQTHNDTSPLTTSIQEKEEKEEISTPNEDTGEGVDSPHFDHEEILLENNGDDPYDKEKEKTVGEEELPPNQEIEEPSIQSVTLSFNDMNQIIQIIESNHKQIETFIERLKKEESKADQAINSVANFHRDLEVIKETVDRLDNFHKFMNLYKEIREEKQKLESENMILTANITSLENTVTSMKKEIDEAHKMVEKEKLTASMDYERQALGEVSSLIQLSNSGNADREKINEMQIKLQFLLKQHRDKITTLKEQEKKQQEEKQTDT